MLSNQITQQGKGQGSSDCCYHNYRDNSKDEEKKKEEKAQSESSLAFHYKAEQTIVIIVCESDANSLEITDLHVPVLRDCSSFRHYQIRGRSGFRVQNCSPKH